MDNNNDVVIFKDDGKNIIVPDITVSEHDEALKSDNVAHGISGEYVKVVNLPVLDHLEQPNYVLDFRRITTMRQHQLVALHNFIYEDGDTAIYIITNKGKDKIGMGISTKLSESLLIGIESVFNGECDVYHNVENGVPSKKLQTNDISSIRLNL